jgi:glycosyltransferase involved in cell wall biosynthesis
LLLLHGVEAVARRERMMKGQAPLISVCMPAHNAEEWIAEAIDSVLEQTYSNFELVISENMSTDRTAEIARAYDDPRIKIEPTTRLIDPVANHNRSVALSTGTYVKFLHADDKLLPTCLEEMVALAGEDERIGLVFAPREVILEESAGAADLDWSRLHGRLHELFGELARINEGYVLLRKMLAAGIEKNWIGEPSAVLVSRDSLASVGLFSPRLHQIADLDLWLRIMLSYRVGYIGHTLSQYRHHGRSVTAQNASDGRDWLDRLWMYEALLRQPTLAAEDRASVRRLRTTALLQACRAQARRLMQRRSILGLPAYGLYRIRGLVGDAPPIADALEPTPRSRDRPHRRQWYPRKGTRLGAGLPSATPSTVAPSLVVTVCILNHNYGRFLAAAIDSVLDQTHTDVDLLVVDDGSTDESREVIERYGDRVRAHLQEQAGQAAAAWSGVQQARGKAILFLDSDDALEPDICARIAEAFHLQPDLAMLQWRLGTIDAEGNSLGRELPPRAGILPSGDLSEHVLRVRNWYYQLTTGAAYATWALRRVLPARLPAGEYHALDQWVNELVPLLGPVRSLDVIGGWHRLHGRNYSAFELRSADWPRRMIELTLNSHARVRSLAVELGRDCPEDARDLRDPALLGWRLWSLTVDREHHPYPDDRRPVIGAQGIVASLAHPLFPWRHRAKRAVWFALVAGLPPIIAQRVIARFPMDAGALSFLPG